MVEKAPKDLPKKAKKNKGWKLVLYILFAMIWVGASMITAQVLVGEIMVLIVGADSFYNAVPMAIYSILSYALMLFLVIYVPAKRIKKHRVISREMLGIRGLPTWTDIGLALVGFIVSIILAMIFVAFFNLFPWFNASETQNLGFSTYAIGFERIVAFLTLVVVAPVAEELVFRGWLYGYLREKTSKEMAKWASILLSSFLVSLLFGIMHFQWNVGVNVFAMSLVLCGLREVTGTIYAGIILHMIKNGLAFYYLYVVGI